MGKMPVAGIAGLVLTGMMLSGCQSSRPRIAERNPLGSRSPLAQASTGADPQPSQANRQVNNSTPASGNLGMPASPGSGLQQTNASWPTTGPMPPSGFNRPVGPSDTGLAGKASLTSNPFPSERMTTNAGAAFNSGNPAGPDSASGSGFMQTSHALPASISNSDRMPQPPPFKDPGMRSPSAELPPGFGQEVPPPPPMASATSLQAPYPPSTPLESPGMPKERQVPGSVMGNP